jgi:hypothetical protein
VKPLLDVFFLDVVFLVLSLSKKDRPVGLRLLSVRSLGGHRAPDALFDRTRGRHARCSNRPGSLLTNLGR